jgi:hypothetical protein
MLCQNLVDVDMSFVFPRFLKQALGTVYVLSQPACRTRVCAHRSRKYSACLSYVFLSAVLKRTILESDVV